MGASESRTPRKRYNVPLHCGEVSLSEMQKELRRDKLSLFRLAPNEVADHRLRKLLGLAAKAEVLEIAKPIRALRGLVIIGSNQIARTGNCREVLRVLHMARRRFKKDPFVSRILLKKYATHCIASLKTAKQFIRLTETCSMAMRDTGNSGDSFN
jgi:hypothetical protein